MAKEKNEEIPSGGKKSKRLIVILLVASLVGAIGAVVIVKKFLGSEPPPKEATKQPVEEDMMDVNLDDPVPSDPTAEVTKLENPSGEEGAASAGDAPAADGAAGQAGPPVVALEPFVVNLDEPGTPRYLKINFQLELGDPRVGSELNRRTAQVRDALNTYLSSLRVRDALGDVAKIDIKENVKRRINNILQTGIVKHVYLTEFVVR